MREHGKPGTAARFIGAGVSRKPGFRVVWSRRSVAGLLATALVVSLAAVAQAAPTWQPATTISAAESAIQSSVDVASDGRGNSVAVWLSSIGGSRYIRAAVHPADGTGWSAPVSVSAAGANIQVASPHVVMDPSGTATTIWVQNEAQDKVAQVATLPLGGSWSAPLTLSLGDPAPVVGDTAYTNLAVAPNGDLTAVWTRSNGVYDVVQTARRPPGGAWSAPVDLSSPTHDAYEPWVAADSAGRGTVVWGTRNTSDQAIILASSRSVAGTWSAAEQLDLVNSWAAGVVMDPAGTATVATTHFNGAFDVTRAITRPAGGPWGPYVPLSSGAEETWELRIAMSPVGDVTLLLGQIRGTTQAIQAAFRPVNGNWGLAVDVPGAAPDSNLEIALSVDDTGTAVAAWSEGKNSVVAARRPAFGVWSAPVDVASSATEPLFPHVTAAGPGDATLTWYAGSAAHAAGLDVEPPRITSYVAPTDGTATQAVAFTASAVDTWTPVTYTWSFGDGTTATGSSVSHAYAGPATYAVLLTVTDQAGNSTTSTSSVVVQPAPVSPPPLVQKPTITRFALTKQKISTDERTKLKVGLSTAAVVKVVLRSKHRHLKDGKRRYLRVVVTRGLPAGVSRIAIKGKWLKPDTWKIGGTATNAAGTSERRKVRLVVVRP